MNVGRKKIQSLQESEGKINERKKAGGRKEVKEGRLDDGRKEGRRKN